MKCIQIGSAVLRALLALAERAFLVEADPDGGHQMSGEAVEPGVLRPRLVVPVLPAMSVRPSASARRPVPRLITSAIMSVMM